MKSSNSYDKFITLGISSRSIKMCNCWMCVSAIHLLRVKKWAKLEKQRKSNNKPPLCLDGIELICILNSTSIDFLLIISILHQTQPIFECVFCQNRVCLLGRLVVPACSQYIRFIQTSTMQTSSYRTTMRVHTITCLIHTTSKQTQQVTQYTNSTFGRISR